MRRGMPCTDSDSLNNPSIAAEVAFASLLGADFGRAPSDHTGWLPKAEDSAPVSDSTFVIDGCGRIRIGDQVVARIPIGMEPTPLSPPPQSRRFKGHGYRGFRNGCSCRVCYSRYCDAVGIVALRIEGWTLESIGNVIGRTRERARQISLRHAPWRPWEAVQAEQRAERELLEQLRTVVKRTFDLECRACGQQFEGSSARRYCSADCRELYNTLRYHVDDERRLKGRRRTAEWVLQNANRVSPIHYRHALNVLKHGPEHGSGRRWLVEGSATWAVAEDACRRRLPIFDELPVDIRRQVQEHLGLPMDEPTQEEAADDGMTTEEALEALDVYFTDEELF